MALTTIDPMPALVAIDLQKGIVSDRDPSLAAVVSQAGHLAAGFRRYDLPVVLVTVTGSAPGRREVGRRGGGDPSSAQWAEIADELKVQPTDHLITKRRYSAFHDTGLSTLLRDLCVTQVVVAGVTTSSAIESSARSAADYGFNVVVATDAVYDPDAEAHRHSVQRIFPKIGETAITAEVISMLEATR